MGKIMEPILAPLLDLAICLPPRGSRDLVHALHRQLRAAILDGRLKPGLKLPPTRALAASLGVSRNTAVAAYDLLLSEGYLAGRQGAGTFVSALLPRPAPVDAPARTAAADGRLAPFWREAQPIETATDPGFRFDLRIGLPDKSTFPFEIWRRLSARALRALSKAPSAYAEAQGRPALRAAIADHVSFTRAVACSAEDVVVTAGAQQAFDLAARVLVTPGRTVVAVEDPGYPPLRAAFAAAGAQLAPVPVDAEGLVVERLPPAARVICVTPSHQCPTGVVLSARRRAALLDFALARDAVVIEDDYDGEFRFAGRPLDALQTLGAASVLYVGTFSKSLFPALRLGFMVAPAWARPALVRARELADWHAAVLAQDTLAAFIAEGHLARHVRKMRKVYGERRMRLIAALTHHAGGALDIMPADAGLHVAARLRTMPAAALVARAAAAGIGVQSLDPYCAAPGGINGIVLGYGLIPAEEIEEAVRRVCALARG
jgi:GntR family transcriptional regulator/MocR family aminotransferase